MPKSSEIDKAKELPPGYHNHGGTANPHPADKPHRPGTQQEKWHLEHGLGNNWYAQHGTTREEYVKEHGEPEAKPRKKPVRGKKDEEPKEDITDYSQVEFKGVMQWNCEKEIKHSFKAEYEKVEKLQSRLDKYKEMGYENSTVYHKVFDAYMKEQGIEPKISPRLLNELPKEVCYDLFQSMINSMKECPFGASAVGNIECFRDPKFNKEIMHFNCDKNGRGFGFGLNMRLLDGRPQDTSPQKSIWVLKDGDTVREDILDADGNPTEWGFHFDDKSTYAQSIIHEYGHSLDYAIGSMLVLSNLKYDPVKVNTEFSDLVKSLNSENVRTGERAHIGYTNFDRIYGFFSPDEKELAEKHELTSLNTRRLYIDSSVYKEYKKEIDEFFDKKGMEVIGSVPEKTNYVYYKIRNINKKLSEEQVEKLRKDGVGSLGKYSSMLSSHVAENTINRVRECEELYKKLYDVDVIDPTQVYSGYGFSGIKMMSPKTDIAKKDEYFRARACKERLAEAYQDVLLRKERSNSMSRLLYAHTQYEILQLTKGYGGTFEDFINDKVGKEKFAERIVKSTLRTLDQKYIDHVRKSLEIDKQNTIRKHQAFIMSVSKQFDSKVLKSGLTKVGIIERVQEGEKWILFDGYSHKKTLAGVKSDVRATLMQYSPSEAEALDGVDDDSWVVPESEAYNDGDYKGYYLDVEEMHEGLWYVHGFCSVHRLSTV